MCNQLVCTESGRRGAGLPRRPQDLALTCQDRARPCGPLGASPRPRAELDGRGREDPSPNLSKATGATLGLLPSSALSFVRSAFSLYLIASFRHRQSCLMQDEPGGRACFACKTSLESGSAMLGIDDQSEQQTGNEPGRDPGFFESQRSRAFRRREKGGGLRWGERVPGGAELGRVGAYGARFAAAIYGEDDGAEPRTDHASDHPIRGGWRRAG